MTRVNAGPETMEQLAKEYGVGIGSIWRSLQSGTKAPAQELTQ
jgi:hypothetical protein